MFAGRVLYEWDLHLLWHTQAEVFVRILAQGAWPLWDPWRSFGQPLLADANRQVLYPATWLHLLARPERLHSALVAVHLLWAGLGTLALGRRLGLSRPAAFAAAALFLVSGPLLSVVHTLNLLFAVSWMPWVLWLADAALEACRVSPAIVWGMALAVQLFAGSPDASAWTALLCAGLVAVRLLHGAPGTGERGRLVARALLAACFALLLSAVQWLPALEAASRSTRWRLDAAGRGYWSFHPAALPELLLPLHLHRLPLTAAVRERLYESRDPFLRSVYLGLPALLLAAAGVAWGVMRHRGLLALAAAIAVLWALGRHAPVQELLAWLLPPLRVLRYPEKALLLAAFTLSLLAGGGYDAWRRSLDAPRLWRGMAATAAAVSLLGLAVAASLAFGAAPWSALFSAGAALTPTAIRVAMASALGLVAALLALRREAGRAASGAPLAAALALVAPAIEHHRLNPAGPREVFTLRPAPLAALAEVPRPRVYVYDYYFEDRASRYLGRDEPFIPARAPAGFSVSEARALAVRDYLFPPSAAAFGVAGSFDLDFTQTYPAFLDAFVKLPRAVEGTPQLSRLLEVGGVTHVLALHASGFEDLEAGPLVTGLFPEPIRVFRVPDTLPRAYLVPRGRPVSEGEALASLLEPGFDPRREVLVETPTGPGRPPRVTEPGSAEGALGTVVLLEERADLIRIEVEAQAPAWLVLLDTWDPGWRASVDGAAVPIVRANAAFRALQVPAGRHVVEERYRPASVTIGALLSGVGWLAAIGALGYARARLSSSRAA